MKNKWKILLLFAFGSILVGISLTTFALLTGGVEAIKERTAPVKRVQTYDDVKDINLDTKSGNILIEEANVEKVTVTYYTDSKFLDAVSVSKNNGALEIKQTSPQYIISGPLEALGYWLNESEMLMDMHPRSIKIQIPKSMVIENLTGSTYGYFRGGKSVSLIDLSIKNINLESSVYAYNSSIENGTIKGNWGSTFSNCHIKNVNFNVAIDHLGFYQSTIENVKITNGTSGLTISESTVKNSSITNNISVESYLDYDGEIYYEEPYVNLDIEKSTLENINYAGVVNISARELTLKGDNKFTGDDIIADLDLASDSKNTIDIDLRVDDGTTEVDSKLDSAQSSEKADIQSNFSRKVDNPTGKLTIQAKRGKISLK